MGAGSRGFESPISDQFTKRAARLFFISDVDNIKIIRYNESMKMTHYSSAQHIKDLAREMPSRASELVFAFSDTGSFAGNVPVLVYSGMSGIAHATALAMALNEKFPEFEFGMAYVRKREEISHGREVEYSLPDSMEQGTTGLLVFVDDFVSSGRTAQFALSRALTFIDAEFKLNIPIAQDGNVFCVMANYSNTFDLNCKDIEVENKNRNS